MAEFNDKTLRKLPAPATGNKIYRDPEQIGLGLRITSAGAKAFVFSYVIAGRERRYTIGPYGPDQWTVQMARRRAGELRVMVDRGLDPLEQREEARQAPTAADLWARF